MGRKRAYNKKVDRRYREGPRGFGRRTVFTDHKTNISVSSDYGTWYRVTTADIPLIHGMEVFLHPLTDLFPCEIMFTLTGMTAQSYSGCTFGYKVGLSNGQKTLVEFIPCNNANQLWYQVVDISTNAILVDRISFYGY